MWKEWRGEKRMGNKGGEAKRDGKIEENEGKNGVEKNRRRGGRGREINGWEGNGS